MAYKFQRGAARLSGSIVAEHGLDTSTTLDATGLASLDGGINVDDNFTVSAAGAVVAVGVNAGGAITGATTISGSGVISGLSLDIEKGADLNGGGITNAGAIAGATTIDASGDLTVATITMSEFTVAANGNTDIDGTLNVEGVPTFQAGAVFSSGITTAGAIAGATTISASSGITGSNFQTNGNINADGGLFAGEIGLADASGIAGTGLDNNGGSLQVAASQTLINQIYNTELRVGKNSNNDIDFQTDNMIVTINGAERFRITDTGNTVVKNALLVEGNLTVEGTTTTVDSTTINISSSFTFEGPADDHETILDSGTPVSDTTIKLPQLAVAGTYYLPALASDPGSAGAISASVGEINLLDGGTARGTTEVVDGDGFIHNDGGTMRMTNVSKIADLFAGAGLTAASSVLAINNATNGGLTINANDMQLNLNDLAAASVAVANDSIAIIDADDNSTKKESIADLVAAMAGSGLSATSGVLSTAGASVTSGSAGATLTTGVNYFGNIGDAISVTLPGSSAPSVGDSVKIKAGADCDVGNPLLINAYANHTIDGEASITLESPFAAVECVYVVSGSWRVF